MKDIDEVLNSIGEDEPASTTPETPAAETAGAGDSQETASQETASQETQKSESEKPEKTEKTETTTVEVKQVVPGSEIPEEKPKEGTEEKPKDEKPKQELKPGEVKTPEEEAAAKAAAEKAAAEKPDDKLKEHADALEKELPGGAHVKEATRKDWDALKTAGKEFKAKYEETQTKLQALEAEKAELAKKVAEGSKELPKEVESEINYLRERVAELDSSSLPEIKANYDDKISQVEKGVLEWFDAASKHPNYVVDELDDEGNATGKKIRLLTPEVVADLKTAVAEKGFLGYNWAAWINQCEKSGTIDAIEATQLRSSLAHAKNLAAHKQVAVEQLKSTWAARKQAETAEQTKLKEEHKQIVEQVATKTKEEFTKLVESKPWAKPPADLPPTATAEEKATHKAAAAAFAEKQALFPKLLKTFYGSQAIRFQGDDQIPHITPDEFIGIVADAFDKRDVEAKVSDLQAKLDAANKELDEFRAGGSTAPKVSRGSDAAPAASPNANLLTMSPQAILDSIG